jgi:hypothetical protein
MAGIALTIEELRPNISSKFSDSRKNPIERNSHEQTDVCVHPSREVFHVRHSTIEDNPIIRMTIPTWCEWRRFEVHSAGNSHAHLATRQIPKP